MYKKIEAQEPSKTLQNCNNNVHIYMNGEGLQKRHVLLTPTAAGHSYMLGHIYLQILRTTRSEIETVTKSWQLTEVGQDREINHCHPLTGTNETRPKTAHS